MCFRITVRTAPDAPPYSYTAIGDAEDLQNAAYDDGALGVTVMVEL
ncbi:hypothetical protein [Massilia sp. HP4]|nr:hypothetical protein [Massilia sp. HP4]